MPPSATPRSLVRVCRRVVSDPDHRGRRTVIASAGKLITIDEARRRRLPVDMLRRPLDVYQAARLTRLRSELASARELLPREGATRRGLTDEQIETARLRVHELTAKLAALEQELDRETTLEPEAVALLTGSSPAAGDTVAAGSGTGPSR